MCKLTWRAHTQEDFPRIFLSIWMQNKACYDLQISRNPTIYFSCVQHLSWWDVFPDTWSCLCSGMVLVWSLPSWNPGAIAPSLRSLWKALVQTVLPAAPECRCVHLCWGPAVQTVGPSVSPSPAQGLENCWPGSAPGGTVSSGAP